MKKIIIAALCLITINSFASHKGMMIVQSNHDVATTTDRLQQALEHKGITVFARIDHAAGAQKADLTLRPTQLLIFGNPKIGTPLMRCQQTVAIDLPQKALIYEDRNGSVWLAYNDPAYLKERHNIQGCDEVLKKISGALANFAKAATQLPPEPEQPVNESDAQAMNAAVIDDSAEEVEANTMEPANESPQTEAEIKLGSDY